MNFEKYLVYSDEVKHALENNLPIVALESTIISHGMPYPQNVETALACEDIIRENGAVPATIAIIDGKIHIGLTREQVEFLASDAEILKASRRDLPYIIMNKKHGATTVAATMICADLAGIKVFATGGIGGVHRGAEKTMDISADLQELAHTEVAVVCAGAKSILDLGLTLEYLETFGVPVVGYQTDVLPAFYTRTSPYKVNFRLDTPEEIAGAYPNKSRTWFTRRNTHNESDSGARFFEGMINGYYRSSDQRSRREKYYPEKKVTPFLLSRVKDMTEGKSLVANIALVKNNANSVRKSRSI